MIDTTGFTDKASKNPDELRLYQDADYITAYSKHTDLRINRDGPELAIGAKKDGKQDWGIHGRAQLSFLRSRGLSPDKTLLDFGCGTGRLAEQAIPFLDCGNYTGVDISKKAVKLCKSRDWVGKEPTFIRGDGTLIPGKFDLIWAHSVFTHSPPEVIEAFFAALADFGEFVFTYKDGPQARTGLKQFRYPFSYFYALGQRHGFHVEHLGLVWPASQQTISVRR